MENVRTLAGRPASAARAATLEESIPPTEKFPRHIRHEATAERREQQAAQLGGRILVAHHARLLGKWQIPVAVDAWLRRTPSRTSRRKRCPAPSLRARERWCEAGHVLVHEVAAKRLVVDAAIEAGHAQQRLQFGSEREERRRTFAGDAGKIERLLAHAVAPAKSLRFAHPIGRRRTFRRCVHHVVAPFFVAVHETSVSPCERNT